MTHDEVVLAVRALRRHPRFRLAGRRGLLDVVEHAAAQGRDRSLPVGCGSAAKAVAAAVVALDGSIGMTVDGRFVAVAPGEAWVHDLHADDAAVRAWSARAPSARALVLTTADLGRGLGGPAGLPPPATGALPVHKILVTADRPPGRGGEMPLDAIARLVGASLVRQFAEPTVLLVLDGDGARAGVVIGDDCALVPLDPDDRRDVDAIVRSFPPPSGASFWHALVVHEAAAAGELTAAFAGERFDRVVWFPDPAAPPRIPEGLLWRLKPSAADAAAHRFSSIIRVVAVPVNAGGPLRAAGPAGVDLLAEAVWRRLVSACRTTGFQSLPVGAMGTGGRVPGTRIARVRRDTCRVALDVDRLRDRWRHWRRLGSPQGFREWLRTGWAADAAAVDDAADRIARAVTNRQVGFAISGGGAFTFRLVPFVRRLVNAGVPFDLIGGVSGGTLLAAYFIAGGVSGAGLEFCAAQGNWFQQVTNLAPFDSGWIEAFVDVQLAGRRVEDTVPPLIALTTALPATGRPASHAVTAGTLGEAVRVSGAAPIYYAPVEKNGVHFADGATAAPIPVRALWEFGADCVFACNSIPGPDRRNPLTSLPGALGMLGGLAYRLPIVSRMIDGVVALTALLDNVSREAGNDADVFVAVDPTPIPLVQALAFDQAEAIAAAGAKDAALMAAADRCVAFWNDFKRTPPRIGA